MLLDSVYCNQFWRIIEICVFINSSYLECSVYTSCLLFFVCIKGKSIPTNKINQLRSAFPGNPPISMCLFRKSTNCKVLVPITHQLRNAFSKNPPTAIHSHYSWWIFGSSTLQLVGYRKKQCAVGGFSEQALCR